MYVNERPRLVAAETGKEANSISPNKILLTIATSCCFFVVMLLAHTHTHRLAFTNSANDIMMNESYPLHEKKGIGELSVKGRPYPLVNVSVLQLDESRADGSNVTLLIGEGHSPRPLGVLELWIGVDSRVAHSAVETIHDHGQLN